MQQYRKKPVVVEAIQWDGSIDSAYDIQEWAKGKIDFSKGRVAEIKTLEGIMTASPNDWIIKGVQGEFYPCKPGIFAETHELADHQADNYLDVSVNVPSRVMNKFDDA